MVHDAVQTLTRRCSPKPSLLASLVFLLPLLGGCGGTSHSTARSPGGPAPGVGESIRLDNCADWNRATKAERQTTVADLRRFAGGPVGSSEGIQNGPVLDDARAYRLFQSYCAKPFARGFKLYKLYTHAAAFIGH